MDISNTKFVFNNFSEILTKPFIINQSTGVVTIYAYQFTEANDYAIFFPCNFSPYPKMLRPLGIIHIQEQEYLALKEF